MNRFSGIHPGLNAKQPRWSVIVISISLAVITAIAYWPVRNFGFVNYDDNDYVYDNARVLSGFTESNIAWAFTTFDARNYHPLTWLSLQLDATLLGAKPQAMHIENVALHALNAILLFVFLSQATNEFLTSAITAALFAVHPTHVESVAWITERKDVLSTLFFLLALLSYLRYAARNHRGNATAYLLAIALAACGLLCKSMLVTIPFVLLLVDYWPLCRIGAVTSLDDGLPKFSHVSLFRAMAEKIPFLALSVAASLLTYESQSTITASLSSIPESLRFQNAALSYAAYLLKTFWPVNLSVIYPYRWEIPWSSVAGSVAVLAVSTIIIFVFGRKRRYAIMGWLWFIGTLVPVIGIVQVGAQSMADRYLYLPSIGLTIVIVWPLCRASAWIGGKIIALTTITVLVALMILSRHQTGYWVDAEHLFSHASTVLNGNAGEQVRLGIFAAQRGDTVAAEGHFQSALAQDPGNYAADFNLGNLLLHSNPALALEHYRAAASKQPRLAEAQINWGVALWKLNDLAGAFTHFQAAESLDPQSYDAHYNLGQLLLIARKFPDARAEFKLALQARPNDPGALQGLRSARSSQ